MAKYNFSSEPTGTHMLIINEISKNSQVLDVGCASGYLGEYLIQEKKCIVIGIEPDEKIARDAKEAGYKYIIVKKIEQALIDLTDKSYDYIILGDVLEHLVEPEKVLNKLIKLLVDDGRVIVSMPNIAHYSVRIPLLFGRWKYTEVGVMDKTHLHFYNLKSGIKMIEQAGGIVERVRPRGDLERWFRIFGLESIGKKILFLFQNLFAIQFIYIVRKNYGK